MKDQSIVYEKDIESPEFIIKLIKEVFDKSARDERFSFLMGVHFASLYIDNDISKLAECKTLEEVRDWIDSKTGLTPFGGLMNMKDKFNRL